MRDALKNISPVIILHYGLDQLAVDGFVYVEITKDMPLY
jgi:hypothetical protein